MFLARPGAAAPPLPVTPSDPRFAFELVRQLGSPRYRDREKAATELVRMGRAAKPALVEGEKNTDPEVQARCEQLLPQALALDLAFRVDRFLSHTEGKLDHDLPLRKTYREKVGTDENARKLYADLLKANGALLEVAEEEPARLTDRVQQRYMEMYAEMFGNPLARGVRGEYRPGAISAAELCCVLFASSLPAYKPAQPDWLLANLYTQPLFTNVLKNEKDGTAYRKLFFGYVEARADDNLINQCAWPVHPAQDQGRGRRHRPGAQGRQGAPGVYQGAMLGGPHRHPRVRCDQVKVLEPFLADATQVQPFFVGKGQRGEVQAKDVALPTTIDLSGKNPKDYGFAMWNVYPNNLIQYHQPGFGSDQQRAAAFKKRAEDGEPAEKKDPPKK